MTSHSNPHLFVYGTLRLNQQNSAADRLQRSADHVGWGRVRGRLYLIAHYPGFVLSESEGDWVHGDVFGLHSPELTYNELDEYEGCSGNSPPPHEYRRSILPVLLDTGIWLDASVYIYAHDIRGKQRIFSGDYLDGK